MTSDDASPCKAQLSPREGGNITQAQICPEAGSATADWQRSAPSEPKQAAQQASAVLPNAQRTLASTKVSVQVLDWRDDVAALKPPYDVVLVADVVSILS